MYRLWGAAAQALRGHDKQDRWIVYFLALCAQQGLSWNRGHWYDMQSFMSGWKPLGLGPSRGCKPLHCHVYHDVLWQRGEWLPGAGSCTATSSRRTS